MPAPSYTKSRETNHRTGWRSRILVALLSLAGTASALELTRQATPDPEAEGMLDQAVPSDPLELLNIERRLAARGRDHDAQALMDLAERSVLLAATGRTPVAYPSLRAAIQDAEATTADLASLRTSLLDGFRLEVPAGLSEAAVASTTGDEASSRSGGAWTRQLSLDGTTLRVPIAVKYVGHAGVVGGIAAQLRIVPVSGDTAEVLTISRRDFGPERFTPGQRFWVTATVSGSPKNAEARLREALRGLERGRYRPDAQVQFAWITPSADPHAPWLIVSRTRGATLDDPYARIPDAPTDPLRPSASGSGFQIPGQCADTDPLPIDRVQGTHSVPSPRGAGSPAPVPLTSPFLQALLGRPVPTDAESLLAASALLRVTQHAEEADHLAALAEGTTLLAILGNRVEPHGTIASALTEPAPSAEDLATLRGCVMAHALRVDLANQDATHGVDSFGKPYLRKAPRATDDYAALHPNPSLPIEVANQSAARLAQFSFVLRLTPATGGDPILLMVDRSGGSPLGGHEHALVRAVPMQAPRQLDAAALDAIAEATRRGEYRASVEDWTLLYEGPPRFRMSARMLDWWGREDRERDATTRVLAASCSDLGACTLARSGHGLSSATTWVVVELFLAVLVPLALARRRPPRRLFAVAYAIYTILAVVAAGLLRVDPPNGGGLSGILSVGAPFLLGLPWNLWMANNLLIIPTLRHFFLDADAGIVAVWIGIGLNHGLLGWLTFRRQRDSAS